MCKVKFARVNWTLCYSDSTNLPAAGMEFLLVCSPLAKIYKWNKQTEGNTLCFVYAFEAFETLGCYCYLQVCKRYYENWTGYAGQHFLRLMHMGFFAPFKGKQLGLLDRSGPIWNGPKFSGAQGRVILVKSGRNLNSFEVLCLFRFPASLMKVRSKIMN